MMKVKKTKPQVVVFSMLVVMVIVAAGLAMSHMANFRLPAYAAEGLAGAVADDTGDMDDVMFDEPTVGEAPPAQEAEGAAELPPQAGEALYMPNDMPDDMEEFMAHTMIHDTLDENEALPEINSPYVVATTLEEVRAIIALGDGRIPVTDVDVPEIRNRQANGIIVTEQCPYEALNELNKAYVQNGHPYYNLTTPWIRMSTWVPRDQDLIRFILRDVMLIAFEQGFIASMDRPTDSVYGLGSSTYSLYLNEASYNRAYSEAEAIFASLAARYDRPSEETLLAAAHRLFAQ